MTRFVPLIKRDVDDVFSAIPAGPPNFGVTYIEADGLEKATAIANKLFPLKPGEELMVLTEDEYPNYMAQQFLD